MIAPFSDNLNRIDKRSRFNTWIKYRSYILTSQSVLCHHIFSGHFCLFFLSSCFFKNFFSALLVLCVLYLLTVLRGCFTPIGLIHLSLLLSPPFLSIFSPVFSFSSFLFLFRFLSFLLFLFFFYLSLQVFGVATAAMPHRFRQACSRSHPNCINKPDKALPRTNVNHLLIIAPSNKHADCKIGYTTISTTLFACLSWKVHRPTAVILYSPTDYWLTWLIKILPIMWQICLNLPTKNKNK